MPNPQSSRVSILSFGLCMAIFVASIATLFIFSSSFAFLYVFHLNHDYLSGIGSFLGSVVTATAFIWLLVNTWMQTIELSLQRRELEMQRLALQQTASSTFNLFFLTYNTHHEQTLDRICLRIIELLNIGPCPPRLTHIEFLASYEEVVILLNRALSDDSIGFLRSDIILYTRIFHLQSTIVSKYGDDNAKTLFFMLGAENPSAQLNNIFISLLEKN